MFLVSSVFAGFQYLKIHSDKQTLREQMVILNNEYKDKPNIILDHCRIDLIHDEYEIDVDTRLYMVNKNATEISEIYFTLNPGMTVSAVRMKKNELKFKLRYFYKKV